MIYKGNQKEGKVYKGGTKIGKIYKGNQLIYQSQPSLPEWGFNNYSVIGEYSLNGLVKANNQNYSNIYLSTISGTLGQSGSQITTSYSNMGTLTYYNTYNFNGIIVYSYRKHAGSGTTYYIAYVLSNSVIGSLLQGCRYSKTNATEHPNSINDSTLTYKNTTHNRNSSQDCFWTINGLV